MTVISVDDLSIRVEGHTGYAPLGEDIACAGLSTLTYALGEWAERNRDKATDSSAQLGSGRACVYFEPLEDYGAVWCAVRDAFVLGCEGLCELFPENIVLIDERGEFEY